MASLTIAFIVTVAASIGLTYVIVKLVLTRVKERVFPLPPGVKAICSFQTCHSPATAGLKEVVEALNNSGEYQYLSEDKPEVYCEKHQPSFAHRHPRIVVLISGFVWVCVIWVLLKWP
jgi:hypothetical protein